MRLDRLQIQGLRCLTSVDVALSDGINGFVGANGAGKSSLLEAAFLLSHGRSFRQGAKDALRQRDALRLSVFGEVTRSDGSIRRLGLGREGSRWRARIDGADASLSAMVHECAVVSFDPGSHALISGPADERRRFLDWGVFHVEHGFLTAWRRYQRALKQRNALIRSISAGDSSLFAPWEQDLSDSAHQLDDYRTAYIELLAPLLRSFSQTLLPELGQVQLHYRRGWPEHMALEEVLSEYRVRDVSRGHTTHGPHRADWSLAFDHAPLREHLSRGQEKLTALACLLAQAQLYANECHEWPVFCLDDLSSELDVEHEASLMGLLDTVGAQVLVTGTQLPQTLHAMAARVFHVEQGRVARLL